MIMWYMSNMFTKSQSNIHLPTQENKFCIDNATTLSSDLICGYRKNLATYHLYLCIWTSKTKKKTFLEVQERSIFSTLSCKKLEARFFPAITY